MDPLTIITAALIAGATAGVTDTVKSGIKDSYNGIKKFLVSKFGHKADVEDSVAKLEASPESKGRQEVLREELEKAGAGQDAELHALAEQLLKALEEDGQVSRQGDQVIIQTGSGSVVVGNNNVTGGAGSNVIGGNVGCLNIDR